MADSDVLPATAKRRRSPACDNCHFRKIKCDSADKPNNICSACLTFGISCTHLLHKKRRGPKVKSLPENDPKTLVATILSATKLIVIPSDESILRGMFIDLASYARNLERQLEQISERNTQSSSSSLPLVSQSSPISQLSLSHAQDDAEARDLLLLQVQRLNIDDDEDKLYINRHLGRSSHYMLLQTALTIRDEVGGGKGMVTVGKKRDSSWSRALWHQFPPESVDPPYQFPEPNLLRELLNLYFDKHHPIYPLLHRPSFERQVYVENIHLVDRRFGAIVLAVCALGSRLTDDPRTFYAGSQDPRSTGWKYFRQIRLTKTSFTLTEPLSLYDVQLYAALQLSVVFLFPTPVGEVSWFLLALGIRSVQEVGAYRKASFKKPSKSHLEEELWRRAFWNLVAMDLYMSIAKGHPRSTREDDFDIELPPECDDEYWEIPSNPELELIQPIGKPSNMSYWHHFIKLLHIGGLVKDHLFTIRKSAPWGDSIPDSNGAIIMELDSALNSWIDELPDHLKWDPHRSDDVLFSQTMCLYLNYYVSVPAPFHSWGPLNTANFPSLAICTNAARSCIHILQAYHARPGMPMLPNYIAPMFVAAVMLLINLWTSLRQKTSYDPRKDMADVYSCLDLLHTYEQRYEIAGRVHDILEAITSVSQMPMSPQKESLKRSRNFKTSQHDSYAQDNFTRQIAGSQRVSNALRPTLASPESPMSYIATDGSSTDSPGHMFDPLIITPQQQIPPVNPPSSFIFDPSAPPSFGTGLDDPDFTASLASAWGETNQEDWILFMSKVDELLHVMNTDGL
ncbi:fungal-specific transcription factor domain-containing protein [Lentinula aciculospora]|uniref:Fungal-specific transcription factor domain-containing protein n=1 Tax=Lentinula aciculospora TaxID=153920 RepID=A0A9W9ADK0_9AGAR|nr:fungal-specific transcription factor domain-containing protein [Lentinula aciculospora]